MDQYENLVGIDKVDFSAPTLNLSWPGDVFKLAGLDDAGKEFYLDAHASDDDSNNWSINLPLTCGSVEIWKPNADPIWNPSGLFAFQQINKRAAASTMSLNSSRKSNIASGNTESSTEMSKETAAYNNSIQCFVVSRPCWLEGTVPSMVPLSITMSDISGSFESSVVLSSIIAGLPYKVAVKSPDFGTSSWMIGSSNEFIVGSTFELNGIEIKLIDKFGNDSVVNSLKYFRVS